MRWNYLLIKELSSEESDLPGYVACRHNASPDILRSIEDIFVAPWSQGGDSHSVKITVQEASTEQGDEYQFVRDYLFETRPVSFPKEGDGVFHRTLREGNNTPGYEDEGRSPEEALQLALDFILGQYEAGSFKACYINRLGDRKWKPFRQE